MPASRAGSLTLSAAIIAATLSLTGAGPRARNDRVPERLADSTFWRMISSFSEPGGTFASENFVSNETDWQTVIPGALTRISPASAYLGVGPEQNFTYIAAFHPHIAFICDIRRQNLIQHLMYKALIEMSSDRADFLSRLWSRRRPDGLDSASDPAALVTAFRAEKADSLFFTLNLGAILDRLVNRHKFALSSEDSATMRAVYGVFFAAGPDISYTSSSGNGIPGRFQNLGMTGGFGGLPATGGTSVMRGSSNGMISISNGGTTTVWHITTDSAGRVSVTRDSAGVAVPDTTFRPPVMPAPGLSFSTRMSFGGMYPSFATLMTTDDGAGVNRGWLGTESAFQWLKDFEVRNLLVPIVGNFAGPKALRAIGSWLKSNDAHVSAFYASNVEQYLFQDRIDGNFYENVGELPTDTNSIFIRSFPNASIVVNAVRRPGVRILQTTSSIDTVLRTFRAGQLNNYWDLAALNR